MHIVTIAARPSVMAAIKLAIRAAERREEVAYSLKSLAAPKELSATTAAATIGVVDMAHVDPWPVLQTVREWLEHNPFAKLVVVPTPLATLDDQRVYFDLGRAGVTSVPPITEAESPEWWIDTLADGVHFDCVRRAYRDLRNELPDGEQGAFVMRIAEHSSAPSVKILASCLYPNGKATLASKRRRLWQESKAVGFHSPEHVLTGVRLLMLKSLLDQNTWSLSRIARQFGFPTARHLARSCKTRYGKTLSLIRSTTREDIYAQVKYDLWVAVLLATTLWPVMPVN